MKLAELTTADFIKELSAKSPTPGGGSVAAFAGALSAALCAMVSRLTVNKEKYRDAWESMERTTAEADGLAQQLLVLMEQDSLAYNDVVAALKLPRETEQQQTARSEAVQRASRKAASVPLQTLRAVASLVDVTRTVVEMGNPNCITDAGAAAHLARAAAHAAAYNVQVNLGGIDDKDFVTECGREVEEILVRLNSIVANLEEKVAAALR
jgi:glutamate formiminotransferase/formiminotetrahydrofolate cyclodeaminase